MYFGTAKPADENLVPAPAIGITKVIRLFRRKNAPPVKPTGLASGHGSGILLRIKFLPPLRTAAKAALLQAAVLTSQ